MKNIIGLLLLILTFSVCNILQTSAQKRAYNFPMDDLGRIKFENPQKPLEEKEKENLVRVITEKFILTTRLKMDDDLTIERTDIGTVLLTNFPLLKEKQKERGISLGEIVRFFNSNSEYRKVINEVLLKQQLRKCL